MEKHIVRSYDRYLNHIRGSVLNMASLVKDLILIASHAVADPTRSLVELADSTDKKINHFDAEIENLAVHMLALRQPLANDLREVICALKLAVILERMGDLAKKVTHRIEFISINIDNILKDLMDHTFKHLQRLFTNVFNSYENVDLQASIKVAEDDHIIDEHYSKIIDLLEERLTKSSENAKAYIDLILIARNLERIGDHINKISYIIQYLIKGDQITSVKLGI